MTIPLRSTPGLWARPLILACAVVVLAAAPLRGEEIEAISAKVSKDYVRKRLPDGSFQPETYVFGEGDNWSGARVDFSIDKMTFMDIARALAVPLAQRQYIPSRDQNSADLLIMVYWGTTRAVENASKTDTLQKVHDADREQDQAQMALNHASSPSDVKVAEVQTATAAAQMRFALEELQDEQQQREVRDTRTVALLGYDSWWMATESASGGGERAYRKKDMLDEVEEDRYFVVLMASDYQALAKKKKNKLLWEVHLSIREHGTEFDKRLPGMIANATEYFGRNSNGLHHVELPEGTVIVGPVQSLGAVPGK
jgi:hypothetical protein